MRRIDISVGVKTFVSSYAVRLNPPPPPALQATEIASKRVKKDQEIVIHGNIIIER